MEIILKKDIEGLGAAFDIVNVKDGYARNYLLPQKFATPATAGAVKSIEKEKEKYAQKQLLVAEKMKSVAEKLSDTSITISAKVSEDEKLFGSVSGQMISEKLKDQGYDVLRSQIVIDEPIKTLGIYNVKVKLGGGLESSVKVWVIKEESEETTGEA
ncbi:MAG: 50S ribosomal protein L9 [Fibrobacterota bacterium]